MWGLIGYEDVSMLGRVVSGFDEVTFALLYVLRVKFLKICLGMQDSQLRHHLPLGALITRLDDVPLVPSVGGQRHGPGAGDDEEDIWTSYLTGTYRPMDERADIMGWCVDSAWWMSEYFFFFTRSNAY
jgi:S2P endopeptidase